MQPKKVIGETINCSVCGKEFKVTERTCCIICGGYTCSTKCFLNEVKRREKEKAATEKPKKNLKC